MHYNILCYPHLCEHFCAGHLHFTDLQRYPEQASYWNPPPLPDDFFSAAGKEVEFWYGVFYWCKEVLSSRAYQITFDGVGTANGGVGLIAKEDCNQQFIADNTKGFLQALTPEQIAVIRDLYHLQSLYVGKKNGKQSAVYILYGPMSLLNCDPKSPLTFLDRKFLSNGEVTWCITKKALGSFQRFHG